MKRILNFFKRRNSFSKEEVLSFAEYWHCKQSLFGYEGEQEKLFNEWLKNKL